LDGGELSEALEDFTGGVAENYDISAEKYLENDEKKDAFFNWLTISLETGSLICVAIPVSYSYSAKLAYEWRRWSGEAERDTTHPDLTYAHLWGSGISCIFVSFIEGQRSSTKRKFSIRIFLTNPAEPEIRLIFVSRISIFG